MSDDRRQPAIAFLPAGLKPGAALSALALENLIWPEGLPADLQGKRVADLGPQDHLLTFPNTAVHLLPNRGTKAQISLVQGEPSVFFRKHLRLLRLSWRRFFRVLTFNETLLSQIPNGVFFPLGSTWVPEWRDLRLDKIRDISLIASAKRDSSGHQLRHRIKDWASRAGVPVEVMGRGYAPFDRKAEGLAPYRFSVVIENLREENYFSEKLVDALLCETVPIYWGCPNIARFVPPQGIIQCNSEADLRQAIETATPERYAALRPALLESKRKIVPYADLESRAVQTLRDALQGP